MVVVQSRDMQKNPIYRTIQNLSYLFLGQSPDKHSNFPIHVAEQFKEAFLRFFADCDAVKSIDWHTWLHTPGQYTTIIHCLLLYNFTTYK